MKKSKKIKVGTTLIITAVVFWGMSIAGNNRTNESISKVSVSTIETTDSIQSLTDVTGTIKINNQSMREVSLETTCRVIEIMVENGQQVLLDDKLIRLEKLSDHTEIILKAESAGTAAFQKEVHNGSIIPQYTDFMIIYNLESTEDFYIEAKIPASDYENMTYIQNIEAAFGNNVNLIKLDASVRDVVPQIVKENNSQYYVLNIQVEDTENILPISMLAKEMQIALQISSTSKSDLPEGEAEHYYVVPFQALVTRGENNVVFLYEKRGSEHVAKMVMVEILNTNSDKAVVRSSALNPNSVVITKGNYVLNGSEKVSTEKSKGKLVLDLIK